MHLLPDDALFHLLEYLPFKTISKVVFFLNKDIHERVTESFRRLPHPITIDSLPVNLLELYRFPAVKLNTQRDVNNEKILHVAPYVKHLSLTVLSENECPTVVDRFPALTELRIQGISTDHSWVKFMGNITSLSVASVIDLDVVKQIVKNTNLRVLSIRIAKDIDSVVQQIAQLADTLEILSLAYKWRPSAPNMNTGFSPCFHKLTELNLRCDSDWIYWMFQHRFENLRVLNIANSSYRAFPVVDNPPSTLPNLVKYSAVRTCTETSKLIASLVGKKIRELRIDKAVKEFAPRQQGIQTLQILSGSYNQVVDIISCNQNQLVELALDSANEEFGALLQGLKHLRRLKVDRFSESMTYLINLLPNLEVVKVNPMKFSETNPQTTASWTKLELVGTHLLSPFSLDRYLQYLPNLTSIRLVCETRETPLQLARLLSATKIQDLELHFNFTNRSHPLQCSLFPEYTNCLISFEDNTQLDEYVLYCLCFIKSSIENEYDEVESTFRNYSKLHSEILLRGGSRHDPDVAIQISYQDVIDKCILDLSAIEKQQLKDHVKNFLAAFCYSTALDTLRSLLHQCLSC